MMNRRTFVAASSAVVAASAATAQQSAPRRLTVGIMGLNRGMQMADDIVNSPGVRLKYVCDVDAKRRESAAAQLASKGVTAVEQVNDFRKMLDDKEIDAIFCAAPNHWHAPATILACAAGKHVYCEKPACHNPQEGEWMVAAAKKYDRCVQIGTQRRSEPAIQDAIAAIHDGKIGKLSEARAFYSRLRGSIGTGKEATPPPTLDYALWQGPAPRVPYRDNVIPYNWHWFWHWGNGELGNNGVHSLDLCRWALGDKLPVSASSAAGMLIQNDDQETPDVQTVGYTMPDGALMSWQGTSRSKHSFGPFVAFYGTEGTIEIAGGGTWKHFDRNNKLVAEHEGSGGGQPAHIANFFAAIRAEDPAQLNQPVESGVASTLLCHLGNIAHRTSSTVQCDPKTGKIKDNDAQQELWVRNYDPQWEKELRAAI